MTFGAQLRALREERGMSMRQLSRDSGLAYSHIQYLENDAKSPGDQTLRKLATALNVPERQLKADQITNEVTMLLAEVRGGMTDEQRSQIVEAVDRAVAKGKSKSRQQRAEISKRSDG